jgi:hypothetical protein
MLYIQDNQRVTVWKAEESERGNFWNVQCSSSRLDKRDGSYKNTAWFARFVKDAAVKAKDLERGDRIVLKGASVAREGYEKDGETLYPKNASLTVYNFDWYKPDDGLDANPQVESEEEDFPF